MNTKTWNPIARLVGALLVTIAVGLIAGVALHLAAAAIR